MLGAPMDPNSVGVRISGGKAIFTAWYGFEHFLTKPMQGARSELTPLAPPPI